MLEALAQNTQFMVFLGLLMHYAQIVAEVNRERPASETLFSFWPQRLAKAFMALGGAILGVAFLPLIEPLFPEFITDELRPVFMGFLAFGAGYSGSVVIDRVGSIFEKYISKF